MYNLQDCERLCPLCKPADAAMNIPEANKGDKKNDTTEDGNPEHRAHEVVED